LSAYIRQFDSHLLQIDKYKSFCVLIWRKNTLSHRLLLVIAPGLEAQSQVFV